MFQDPKLFGYLVPVIEGPGTVSLVGERIKKMGGEFILDKGIILKAN